MDPLCKVHRLRARQRRAATATELIVAATLLVSALGTIAPLAIGTGRIRHDARHYQLAIEELSNQLDRQLDRLSRLDADQRDAALTQLAPSEEISEILPEAALEGEVISDEDGTRLALTLQWRRPAGAVPLRLVGWLDALPSDSAAAADSSPEQSVPTEQEAERS